MVGESAVELDRKSGASRLAPGDRQSRRVRIDSYNLGLTMHSLNKHSHRSGAASNVEHAKSGFDPGLFDQRPLRFVRAQQPQERIVDWKQPAFPEGGDVTSLGVIDCSGCWHQSLLRLPWPRY